MKWTKDNENPDISFFYIIVTWYYGGFAEVEIKEVALQNLIPDQKKIHTLVKQKGQKKTKKSGIEK